ncbi:MAG TPA: VWA domain-containing protein [Polyangiaceae bacterium]|nr:VWA domain-containing protein [Polyangiaceae bacterium]
MVNGTRASAQAVIERTKSRPPRARTSIAAVIAVTSWMSVVAGCAPETRIVVAAPATPTSATAPGAALPLAQGAASSEPADKARAAVSSDAIQVFAAAESSVLRTGTSQAFIGVGVDVPRGHVAFRPKVAVGLLVDTSGSMAGAKIESARRAATTFVQNLVDGDVVGVDVFDDTARTLVVPTVLDAETRPRILAAIAALGTGGSTNMFDGLTLSESHLAGSPATHAVRRVVILSDGRANVGRSSAAELGNIAERGLASRVQVTSLGVGLDYDESTLNALSVRSSGRLYHIGDPREMTATLQREVALIGDTVASDASLEVVPAPGVRVIGAEGVHSTWNGRAFRIPLGALFAGQHREALVRVALDGAEAQTERPLASVRLVYRDPRDGDLERVKETVARVSFSSDDAAVARGADERVKAMVSLVDAGRVQIAAAQRINEGDFAAADRELSVAQRSLEERAHATRDVAEKKRLDSQAQALGATRSSIAKAAAAPKPVQRSEALKLNKEGMSTMGF